MASGSVQEKRVEIDIQCQLPRPAVNSLIVKAAQ